MTEYMQDASVDPIEVVRRHSLTALVRDEIERHIVEGELAPGDKLNEASGPRVCECRAGRCARRFEALEQAGLVRTEKNRACSCGRCRSPRRTKFTRCAPCSRRQRAACAASIDAQQLAVLRDWLDAMRTALDTQDADAYARANVAFHDAIVAAAGNVKLYETYRRLVSELSLFRRAALVVHADAMERSLASIARF